MKTLLLFIFVLSFTLFSTFTTSAQAVRRVSNFTGLASAGAFDITLVKSDKNEVHISGADEQTLEKIETEVGGNTLKIGFKRHTHYSSKEKESIRITVYYTNKLRKISLAGSGFIKWNGLLHSSDELEVSLSGSGDIEGEIAVVDVEIGIAGSGNVRLCGAATRQNISIAGSGDYEGRCLKTQTTQVHIAGSGNAEIYVTKRLEASIAGSGDVDYITGGNELEHAKASIIGSGKVRKL